MKRALHWLGWLIVGLWIGGGGLAACVPATPAAPLLPVPSPTSTLTPTPTQVPFPPTVTPTPLPPTVPPSPTPDPLRGAGNPVVTEDFTDPTVWVAGRSTGGTLAVAQGMLSLSVPQGPGFSVALRREPALTNFVVQTVARPRLCRGQDAYGVVLRADARGSTYYRLGLTCDGQAFAEYVQGGTVTLLVEPVPIGLPTGPPVQVPLLARLYKQQFQLYVYGNLVFEGSFRGRYQGLAGAFVRAKQASPAAVDFLQWEVRPLEGKP